MPRPTSQVHIQVVAILQESFHVMVLLNSDKCDQYIRLNRDHLTRALNRKYETRHKACQYQLGLV